MTNKPFTRTELINVLRGWYKSFKRIGRSHERNVQALTEAADLLEYDRYRIENQPRYDDEEDY